MVKYNRVRACFDCKTYIPIFPDNPEAIKDEQWFNTLHNHHMVQTMSISELDGRNDFTCVSRFAREKALKEVQKGLKQ
ncbi:MAG: hypothetical protein GY870_12495 [archaeon]|nr:hypothetical protein [archaeon]